jgi:hypothetical protein
LNTFAQCSNGRSALSRSRQHIRLVDAPGSEKLLSPTPARGHDPLDRVRWLPAHKRRDPDRGVARLKISWRGPKVVVGSWFSSTCVPLGASSRVPNTMDVSTSSRRLRSGAFGSSFPLNAACSIDQHRALQKWQQPGTPLVPHVPDHVTTAPEC